MYWNSNTNLNKFFPLKWSRDHSVYSHERRYFIDELGDGVMSVYNLINACCLTKQSRNLVGTIKSIIQNVIVVLFCSSSTLKQQLCCSISNVLRRRYSLYDYSLLNQFRQAYIDHYRKNAIKFQLYICFEFGYWQQRQQRFFFLAVRTQHARKTHVI